MKKKLTLLFIVLMIAFTSACSSANDEDTTSTDEKNNEAKKEVIKVGATTTGPPFTFLNTKTNEIDGLMVDIANKVGEELGRDIEIVESKFASLIPAIESGRIDMISAGMIISEERKKIIDFTEPVYEYGEGLVVLKDTTGLTSLEDLKGKNVGVQEGTLFYDGLQEHPEINAKAYKSIADMMKELENGRIDAFIGDYPIVKHMLVENPDFNVKVVEEYEPSWLGDVGLGVAKDAEEFKNELNEAIQKIKDNGELDAIIEKWGL